MPQLPPKPPPRDAAIPAAAVTPAKVPARDQAAPEPGPESALVPQLPPDGLAIGQKMPGGSSQSSLSFLADRSPPVRAQLASPGRQAQALMSVFTQQLQRLDRNQNGFVSQKELDQAISGAAPRDKAGLLALRAHLDSLSDYANDELGPERSGISLADLQAFVAQSLARPEAEHLKDISGSLIATAEDFSGSELLDFAREKFESIDTDKDGFLSRRNLREALAGGDLSSRQQSIALKLMAYLEDIEELANDETGDENDGITRADLARLIQQGEFDVFASPSLGPEFQRMSALGLARPPHTQGASMDYRVAPTLPKPALPAPTLVRNHAFPGAKMDAHLYDLGFGGHRIAIYIPTPAVANQPTAENVLDALAGLPEVLRREFRVVQVSPAANPEDAHWAQKYKMPGFVSDMTAGPGGEITIYNAPAGRPAATRRSVQQIHEGMLHEGGHLYADRAAGFKWSDWEAAMNADIISPSSYASTNKGEDFSDSLRLYLLTKHNAFETGVYQAQFPNRFKWFREHGF